MKSRMLVQVRTNFGTGVRLDIDFNLESITTLVKAANLESLESLEMEVSIL